MKYTAPQHRMLQRTRVVLAVLLLSLWAVAAFPQSFDNNLLRRYSTENGLPYNSVKAICQDKYGFIWFGLDNALCRYDGVQMRTFRHNPSSASQYTASLMANDTCLWIGTGNGVTMMRFQDETFTPFRLATAQGTPITSTVYSIVQDRRGRIWFATYGQGVFCYDARHRQLFWYPMNAARGYVSQMAVDQRGGVWAATRWGHVMLYRFDEAVRDFRPFYFAGASRYKGDASAILIDSKGCKWIGTYEHGLVRISSDGRSQCYLSSGTAAVHKIHSLLEMPDRRLLIGSDDGLTLFDPVTGQSWCYVVSGILPDKFVYPLMRDREGGLWIGTFYDGVNYISPMSRQFTCYSHTSDPSTIGGNIINRFVEDKNGCIYIASDDGGLSRLDPDGHITRFPVGTYGLSSNNVHALWADSGGLWVGTYSGGICYMGNDGRSRRYNAYEMAHPVPDAANCYSLFRDSRGTLWCGTLESVSRYDPKADCFRFVKRLGTLVGDIDEDHEGNLWFSTQGSGLFRYNPRTRAWRRFFPGRTKTQGGNSIVNCLFVDSRRQILAAGQDGLYRYDPRRGDFARFLPDVVKIEVSAITEEHGTYWISTVNGLLKYREGQPPRWFNKNDGLPSNQFLPNALLQSSNGRIYLGTNYGFCCFNPSAIRQNMVVPPVAVTGLDILNHPVATGSKTLPRAVNHLEQLELPYSDNVFTLHFAAQSYCTPENNQYAYRLDGFDRDWNYVGNTSQATYTNLSPGTYTFRVKGTNNDGVWSKEAVLKIVIHPPFYWSLPMKIIYLVCIMVAVVLLWRWMIHRVEKRHREETERIRTEKEREVREARLGFFTMIAHEIRTPVSLIIAPLENIMKQAAQLPAALADDLHIIDRNSNRLLSLVNQLLDYRKVEQQSFVLRFTRCDIVPVIRGVCERFCPTFKQKHIDFTVVCPDGTLMAMVDSEAFTKVISNLLSNAVKYARSKVCLECTVMPDNTHFTIVVKDDGQGIRPEDHERIFLPFYQSVNNRPGTGIGLSIVKGIVDGHHGTITVDSTPGSGAAFTVVLPLQQAEQVTGNPMLPEEQPVGEETPDAPIPVTASASRPTILVVEDNEDLLNFIAKVLSTDYNILQSKDGQEAFDILQKRNDIDLVLSDWMMPYMSGETLCRRLRQDPHISHLPFILLTAKTDVGSKITGMQCGADSFIEKPFSVKYLQACIRNLIHMRQVLKHRFTTQPLATLDTIASNKMDNDFLQRLQQLIEENFSNSDLSVNFLASHLGVSRSGLFAKIKSLTDMTPNDMITLVRLRKAARLLLEHRYQNNEICYMVGLSNPSYFSKCFKKQFGITPAEFAASHQK